MSETPRSRSIAIRSLRRVEEGALCVCLIAAVAIPIAEIVARRVGASLGESSLLLRHLTLFIGLLGAAIAARDDRLLSLGAVREALPEVWRARTKRFGYSVGAFVSFALAIASVNLIRQEFDSITKVVGVPVWVYQLVLPIGFALIGARLIWTAGSARSRWIAAGLALFYGLVVVGVGVSRLEPSSAWLTPLLIAVLVAAAFGSPVFATLGGAALAMFWTHGRPIDSMAIHHYSLVTNPSLPAIPLFTIAGYFLSEGAASRRILNLFQAIAGGVRGGVAVATVFACAFFTSFSGASGITILALGGVVVPGLIASNMKERDAIGLVTSSGAIGLLFAPCLPLILFAIVAQETLRYHTAGAGLPPDISIERMFLAGVLPGFLLVFALSAWGVLRSPRRRAESMNLAMERPRLRDAAFEAKWEILIPIIALGAIFSGWATPVEAAALTAAYVFFSQTVIHREVHVLRDAPRVLVECGSLVGGVLLIFGVAIGLTKFLVLEQIPTELVEWMTGAVESKWAFLLILNLFLLLVGFLMDIFSAIVVVAPLIIPLGLAFGMDPAHLGILFLANLELGYLTPPVGLNLFLASSRFERPLLAIFRAVAPILPVMVASVLIITFVPALSTTLPNYFLGPSVTPESAEPLFELEGDDEEYELDLDF